MAIRSRLYRTQKRRSLRQAALFFSLTIVLILIIIFFGIPLLVKTASFLLDLRSANTPATTSSVAAPPPPQLFPATEATNSATINLSGFSQSGNQIALFQNGDSIKTVVTNQEDQFQFANISLETGENSFWASAKSPKGIESQISNQITITLDQSPPSLEISSPQSNDKFYGPHEKTTTIKGKTEPHTTLYLNDRLINVTPTGDFNHQFVLTEGENQLHFQATDAASNATQTDLVISYSP